jgi:hypothetical protein
MAIITTSTVSTGRRHRVVRVRRLCGVCARGGKTSRTDSQTEEGQLSMVKSLTRIGDRILERVVPKTTASAACGNFLFCYCAWSGDNYMDWRYRKDVEHGGQCQPCQPTYSCL